MSKLYHFLEVLKLRRARQARNFTTNVPKILDLQSSSEQIFSKSWRWLPLINGTNNLNFTRVGEHSIYQNWGKERLSPLRLKRTLGRSCWFCASSSDIPTSRYKARSIITSLACPGTPSNAYKKPVNVSSTLKSCWYLWLWGYTCFIKVSFIVEVDKCKRGL